MHIKWLHFNLAITCYYATQITAHVFSFEYFEHRMSQLGMSNQDKAGSNYISSDSPPSDPPGPTLVQRRLNLSRNGKNISSTGTMKKTNLLAKGDRS